MLCLGCAIPFDHLAPGKVKPESQTTVVLTDFTKIGAITTAALNKHCQLLLKLLSRSPYSYLEQFTGNTSKQGFGSWLRRWSGTILNPCCYAR